MLWTGTLPVRPTVTKITPPTIALPRTTDPACQRVVDAVVNFLNRTAKTGCFGWTDEFEYETTRG